MITKLKSVKRKCLFCNKEIMVPPHEIKHGWGKFCSRSCIMKYRYLIEKPIGEKNPHWEGVKETCKGCGKEFHIFKCMLGIKKYCSKTCKSNFRKRISSLNVLIRNSLKYIKWRTNIFRRDGWTCRMCKSKVGLQVHHIKKLSRLIEFYRISEINKALSCKGLWNKKNGITLCIECHKLTENYGRKG